MVVVAVLMMTLVGPVRVLVDVLFCGKETVLVASYYLTC